MRAPRTRVVVSLPSSLSFRSSRPPKLLHVQPATPSLGAKHERARHGLAYAANHVALPLSHVDRVRHRPPCLLTHGPRASGLAANFPTGH